MYREIFQLSKQIHNYTNACFEKFWIYGMFEE